MTGSTVFWYASRATGIVALLLLTAVLVLGLVVTRQGRLLALAVGCALVVGAAVAWRLAAAARQVPRAGRVAAVFAEHTSPSSRRTRPGRRPASR
jgi:uncharacterized membrane protein YraQ (UPF0718 family)